MNVVGRAKAMLTDPLHEWERIEREAGDPAFLLSRYVAVLALVPAGAFVVDNDFTYATSALSCSSLTSPWNTGMMGLNPLTIFAPGVKMDSRM